MMLTYPWMPIQFLSVSDPSFEAWLLRISSTTFTTHLTTLTAWKWKKSWQQNIFVLVFLRYMRIHALKQHNNWIEIFCKVRLSTTVSRIHYKVGGWRVWWTRNLPLYSIETNIVLRVTYTVLFNMMGAV